MSQAFYLVCHDTKQRIWVGQGWGKMTTFYSGEKKTMAALKSFLQDHEGRNIVLLCGYINDHIRNYKEYEE